MMKRVIVIMLMTLGLLLPVSCTPSANAATIDGCSSEATQKANSWGKTVDVKVDVWDQFPGTASFRLAAYAKYWFCPNGDNPNKIKVIGTVFCATKLDNHDPFNFDGFKWNPYYFTLSDGNAAEANPPTQMLSWNGFGDSGDQHCDEYDIRPEYRVWMRMSYDPAWTLSGFTVYDNHPDDDWHFTDDGHNYKLITPGPDPNVTL